MWALHEGTFQSLLPLGDPANRSAASPPRAPGYPIKRSLFAHSFHRRRAVKWHMPAWCQNRQRCITRFLSFSSMWILLFFFPFLFAAASSEVNVHYLWMGKTTKWRTIFNNESAEERPAVVFLRLSTPTMLRICPLHVLYHHFASHLQIAPVVFFVHSALMSAKTVTHGLLSAVVSVS